MTNPIESPEARGPAVSKKDMEMDLWRVPLTPRMRQALAALALGEQLVCAGRPTKQRLAKYGLAEFLTPRDWDGPQRITMRGRALLAVQ